MKTFSYGIKNNIKYIIALSKHASKHKQLNRNVASTRYWSNLPNPSQVFSNQSIEFHGVWPEEEKTAFLKDMKIIPDFITCEEETKLFEEIEPYMKRLRYEFDHWDDAIHGFRETERKNWYPHNRKVIERVRSTAFDSEIMQYVHVLDLAKDGVIKPHVDSSRYCGTTISGISMLSDAVMRLVRTDEKKFQQGNGNVSSTVSDDAYRDQPYLMRHSARYNFTHEILSNENSVFRGSPIVKDRRISIICRNEP